MNINKILATSVVIAALMTPVFAMADTFSATVADNEISVISTINDVDLEEYKACANIYGTFGTGELSILISTDAGTTKSELEFSSGTGRVFTEAGNFCWRWQGGSGTIFYASMDQSSSASVSVDVNDNQ
jgi:hypothetical protein